MLADPLVLVALGSTLRVFRSGVLVLPLSLGSWSQCLQPSSPSIFGFGRDGLQLIVHLFRGARTDYAREDEDWTDYRGL